MTTNYTLEDLVKHRRTMLLLDRLVSHDEDTITAEVTISERSTFLDGDQVPAWVGMEYAAQAVAALSGLRALAKDGEPKVGFLLSCRRYKSQRSSFKLGEVITIKAQEEFNDGRMGAYRCSLSIDHLEVATLTLSAYIPDTIADMQADIQA